VITVKSGPGQLAIPKSSIFQFTEKALEIIDSNLLRRAHARGPNYSNSSLSPIFCLFVYHLSHPHLGEGLVVLIIVCMLSSLCTILSMDVKKNLIRVGGPLRKT
jgi:hypothetical protein